MKFQGSTLLGRISNYPQTMHSAVPVSMISLEPNIFLKIRGISFIPNLRNNIILYRFGLFQAP